ncbi:MAG: hypothetical protein JWO05_1160 [Gemmatimonadetes bacterium]|nr:hypothetical protein [Gemmatimonadota bacterium]
MRFSITTTRTGPGYANVAKQVAFATARALNVTATQIQEAERGTINTNFTVRKSGFINRLVKIRKDDWATKENLRARVRIEGPQNDEGRSVILTRHEEGGSHSKSGADSSADSHFYIPTDVIRHPFSASIPQRLYPKNLRLQTRRTPDGVLGPNSRKTKRGKVVLEGKLRTFVLNYPNSDRPIGIFQRKEGKRGKSARTDISLIWYYSRTVKLKPRLQFANTSRRIYEARYRANFATMYAQALATAR